MDRPLPHYATYFDKHYLTRGLTLYASLVRHSPPFVLWILCLDDETRATLSDLQLRGIKLVSLRELERADPELLAVRPTRKPVEYYWTCGPAFLRHLFEASPEIDMLTYLDADMCLFGDPSPVYEELGSRDILIVEHRLPPHAPPVLHAYGKYNVGLLVFRRSASSLACLQRWRQQCLEWCFYRREDGRYGDQMYLEEWPDRYNDVVILQHQGAGLAGWNIGNYRCTSVNGQVLVDGVPLVSYHFSSLRRITSWFYDTGAWHWNKSLDPVVIRQIYEPYVRQLVAGRELVESVGGPRPRLDNILRKERLPRLLFWTLWRHTYVLNLPTVVRRKPEPADASV